MESKTVFSEKQTTAMTHIQGENILIQGQAVYGGESNDIRMNNGQIFKIGYSNQQVGDCYINNTGNVQISFYEVEDLTLMPEASTLLNQIYNDIKNEAGV